MCNKKEKRVILLNNPIESTESDLFGINIYDMWNNRYC